MQRLSFIILLFLVVVTTGCGGASGLAAKIEGKTWVADPAPLELNHAAPATITTTFSLGPCENKSGDVKLTSIIKEGDAETARVTCSGVYSVTSSTTMKLNPDTTTVELITIKSHRSGAPALETLKAGQAVPLKQELLAVMLKRYSRYNSIRDIQVNDGMMQWWTAGHKTVLTTVAHPPIAPG